MIARGRRTERLIAALMRHRTIADAASSIGISEVTVRRALKDPDFAAKFREARQEIMRLAVSQLQQATIESIAALRELAAHGESEGSRVAAARTILENGLRSYQFEQLEARVEDLERLAGEQAGGQ